MFAPVFKELVSFYRNPSLLIRPLNLDYHNKKHPSILLITKVYLLKIRIPNSLEFTSLISKEFPCL